LSVGMQLTLSLPFLLGSSHHRCSCSHAWHALHTWIARFPARTSPAPSEDALARRCTCPRLEGKRGRASPISERTRWKRHEQYRGIDCEMRATRTDSLWTSTCAHTVRCAYTDTAFQLAYVTILETDSEKRNNETTRDTCCVISCFQNLPSPAFAQPFRELRRYRDRVTRFIARTRGQRRTLSLITVDVQEERNNAPLPSACLLRKRARAQAHAETRGDLPRHRVVQLRRSRE